MASIVRRTLASTLALMISIAPIRLTPVAIPAATSAVRPQLARSCGTLIWRSIRSM